MARPSELIAWVTTLLESHGGLTLRLNSAGELLVDTGDGHVPVVIVDHHRGDERAAVLLGYLAPEGRVPERDLLALVMQIGAGAIGLVGGAYWLRFTIPAPQLELPRLLSALDYVTSLARDLAGVIVTHASARLDPTTPAESPFAHLADG